MNSVPAPVIERAGKSPRHARPHLPGWLAWLVEHRAQMLAVFAFAAIVIGGLLLAVGEGAAGQTVWGVAVAVLAAELTVEVGRTVVVEHSLGVDTIALVAMVGALELGEELAGVVIGLMFSGGAALDAIASQRARRELTALVQRAHKKAQLRVGDRL
jgi:cation transport ATPase